MSKSCNKNSSMKKKDITKPLYMAVLFAAICGLGLGIYAGTIANEDYEIHGAWYSVLYWSVFLFVISMIIIGHRTDPRALCNDVRMVVFIQLTIFVITEWISWTEIPNILVSARLSTAPVVVLLAAIAVCSLIINDILALRISLLIMVPIMIAGRFTVHFLGGSPEISGITVFEIRCLSELLIPVTALIFSFMFERSGRRFFGDRETFFRRMLNGGELCIQERVNRIRKAQLLLCILSLLLSIFGLKIDGYLVLNALFVVPVIIIVSDTSVNKYLVALALLTKLIYDLSETAFIRETGIPTFFIILDILALVFALLGYRKVFYIAVKTQIAVLLAALLFETCCAIARDYYYFYRVLSVYISEMMLYESYALFSLWGRWTAYSPLHYFRWIMDPTMDEAEQEWVCVEKRD